MKPLEFHLHAAGAVAPGIGSLAMLRAIASGAASYEAAPLQLPSPAMLPAQERRRASQAVRLVLACIDQALQGSPFAAQDLRSVFATDEGTGEVCQQMLETLATTRQVSPLLFSNSVVNAPSGYFSIAWRTRRPATVVSLGMESFASGLLCAVTEALADNEPVLLVVYDPAMTAPLNELLPIAQGTAAAWIVSGGTPRGDAPVLASFALSLEDAGAQPASPLPGWMPAAWAGHASARALAALSLMDAAAGAAGGYPLGGRTLRLQCMAKAAP
ncbi:beta-ketoacyl synthase chain length factor [Caenimonas aquaedulcis]|uniref:Beta-ketoacyl synthase chain length factor n=1 Tax=Caenimonas aquaedulcis TaxID=2793270 RepID=A0A931MHS2_9BURK|nr:beta-ketoacyl synthase chain length factor [Caenimonas aquaedulcis]MBG9388460.1 beta-ketoacyl synthase chain length factor [Caenimonas aquaedulcis]